MIYSEKTGNPVFFLCPLGYGKQCLSSLFFQQYTEFPESGKITVFLTSPAFLTHSYAFFTSLDLGPAPWFKVIPSAKKR